MLTALSILIWAMAVIFLFTLLIGLAIAVLELRTKLREHRTKKPPPEPVFHRCNHCRRSHAGPEDCENWNRVW